MMLENILSEAVTTFWIRTKLTAARVESAGGKFKYDRMLSKLVLWSNVNDKDIPKW